MKNRTFILLVTLIILSYPSIEGTGKPNFRIESAIKFIISNAGIEVSGTIDEIEANIKFNPNDLENSFIHAAANPATIRTGISIRDNHLKKSDYLDIKNFPKISLISKEFRRVGRSKFIGKFDLTIKGISKEIAIPFTRHIRENRTHYKGYFEINRLEFDLGEKSAILGNMVKISLNTTIE